jgi:hypothetical protein
MAYSADRFQSEASKNQKLFSKTSAQRVGHRQRTDADRPLSQKGGSGFAISEIIRVSSLGAY